MNIVNVFMNLIHDYSSQEFSYSNLHKIFMKIFEKFMKKIHEDSWIFMCQDWTAQYCAHWLIMSNGLAGTINKPAIGWVIWNVPEVIKYVPLGRTRYRRGCINL